MRISARSGDHVYRVDVVRQNGLYVVEVDGVRYEVDARKLEGDFYSILMEDRSYEVSVDLDGDRYHVRHGATEQVVELTDPGRAARERARKAGPEEITSVMPGRVVRVLVEAGQAVQEGQGLVVVEAMKMENEIVSPKAGTVRAVEVSAGQAVEAGGTLIVVE